MNTIPIDKFKVEKMLPRIKNVIANDDFTLTLTFDNDEVRVFDMKPYIYQKGFVFEELNDIELFKTVKPWDGSIQWIHHQDLCPDTLYLRSIAIS